MHQQSSITSLGTKTLRFSIRQDLLRAQLWQFCLETSEEYHTARSREHMGPFQFYGDPASVEMWWVLHGTRRPWKLALGGVLWGVLCWLGAQMWTAWSEQRLWQGSGRPVVFHRCSMPSNLFVSCLLMVTSDLLAGTECLKVSSKVIETAARTALAGKSFCLEIWGRRDMCSRVEVQGEQLAKR